MKNAVGETRIAVLGRRKSETMKNAECETENAELATRKLAVPH
jgi:hypothetical protein